MPKPTYIKSKASARIFGPNLDPLEVTKKLLLPPDVQTRVGEPKLVRTRKGDVMHRMTYDTGLWLMSSEHRVDSRKLKTHIIWLLEQLEPKRQAVLEILSEGQSADIFCFSCGRTSIPPSLPSELRKRAGELGFEIVIDHYDSSNDS